ncbi:MAG: hypothetical protein ACK559_27905, partial [bacterium]
LVAASRVRNQIRAHSLGRISLDKHPMQVCLCCISVGTSGPGGCLLGVTAHFPHTPRALFVGQSDPKPESNAGTRRRPGLSAGARQGALHSAAT